MLTQNPGGNVGVFVVDDQRESAAPEHAPGHGCCYFPPNTPPGEKRGTAQ